MPQRVEPVSPRYFRRSPISFADRQHQRQRARRQAAHRKHQRQPAGVGVRPLPADPAADRQRQQRRHQSRRRRSPPRCAASWRVSCRIVTGKPPA